jgi:hypothetical protein
MGTAALVVGIAVVVLTAASQTGVLGRQDFLVIAAVGLLGAAFSLVIALMQRSRAALAGLLLSLLPVALLVYYLSTTESLPLPAVELVAGDSRLRPAHG